MSANPTIYLFTVDEQDYAELRRISTDGGAMAEDYSTFAAAIEDHCQSMRDQGGFPVQVYCSPVDLAAWCRDTGRDVDSGARATYAAISVSK